MGTGAEFGARVKAARIERDLTKPEAARLAGVSTSTWRNYERGAQLVTGGTSIPVTPTRRIVIGIAKPLGWSRVDALTWAGLEDEILGADREADQVVARVADQAETSHPPELARLADYWDRMSQCRRALLLQTAAEFADDEQDPEQDNPGDDVEVSNSADATVFRRTQQGSNSEADTRE